MPSPFQQVYWVTWNEGVHYENLGVLEVKYMITKGYINWIQPKNVLLGKRVLNHEQVESLYKLYLENKLG